MTQTRAPEPVVQESWDEDYEWGTTTAQPLPQRQRQLESIQYEEEVEEEN